MPKEAKHEAGYVRKVQQDTRRYVESLLKENETLRTLVARVRSEKLALEEQILIASEQLQRKRQDQVRLQQQIVEIEAEHQRFNQEYQAIEEQNSNLANLYVASYRLHGTLDRGTVLETILEILINLVGSEEIGVFELDPDASVLTLAASYGIEKDRYRAVPLDSGIIGRVAQSGESYFGTGTNGNGSEREEALTACIALKVDEKITGTITVFSLLPQKKDLQPVDHELFELLATHAATALFCTGIHAGTRVRATAS
jgi:hypothetical protein